MVSGRLSPKHSPPVLVSGWGRYVLCAVTTLYFGTDTPDDLRKPAFSKERSMESQMLVGFITDFLDLPH